MEGLRYGLELDDHCNCSYQFEEEGRVQVWDRVENFFI